MADGNGWILSAISFIASEYGWNIEKILHENLLMIMLLLRQASYQQHGGFGLLDEEKMNNMSWEDLVRENHKKFTNMKL